VNREATPRFGRERLRASVQAGVNLSVMRPDTPRRTPRRHRVEHRVEHRCAV